eukprot:2204514-Pleurochrysis_carterae.AAC.1
MLLGSLGVCASARTDSYLEKLCLPSGERTCESQRITVKEQSKNAAKKHLRRTISSRISLSM